MYWNTGGKTPGAELAPGTAGTRVSVDVVRVSLHLSAPPGKGLQSQAACPLEVVKRSPSGPKFLLPALQPAESSSLQRRLSGQPLIGQFESPCLPQSQSWLPIIASLIGLSQVTWVHLEPEVG